MTKKREVYNEIKYGEVVSDEELRKLDEEWMS
jgi:hypothetical protein